MSAGILDITVEQGARFSMMITVNDSLGAPIDLTGATFEGQIRATHDSLDAAAQFTFTLQNQTTDKGKVLCEMYDTITAAIPVSGDQPGKRVTVNYLYDISYYLVTHHRVRILQGVAKVVGEVTK